MLHPELVPAEPFRDPSTIRSIYNGGNTVSRVLAMIVGIVAVAGEYRHRTLGSSYLATPRRLRLIGAKALVLLLFGLLYGVASVAAGMLAAVPFVLRHDGAFFLGRLTTYRSLGLGVISIALWALLGLGIALLIRSMVVALLVGVAFGYVVEPVLSLLCFVQRWFVGLDALPSGASNAMLGITSPVLFANPDPPAWWRGALVLGAWCLLPAVAGVLAAARRDVT